MHPLRSVAADARGALIPLFEVHRYLRVGLDGILEGRFGDAWVPKVAERLALRPVPAARLELGPFTWLAGDATTEAAHTLVSDMTGKRALCLPDAQWEELVEDAYGGAIYRQHRLAFSAAKLNAQHITLLAGAVPAGCRVARMDTDLAIRSMNEVSDDLLVTQIFESPAALVKGGVGFCALDGDRVVSAATSGMLCRGHIEIQVNTHPEHQRRGLARAVAAALIAHCLEEGIEPHWDSAAAASQALARELGYVPAGEWAWWFVDAGRG